LKVHLCLLFRHQLYFRLRFHNAMVRKLRSPRRSWTSIHVSMYLDWKRKLRNVFSLDQRRVSIQYTQYT